MTTTDLTPAEMAALEACAAGDVWCGLGLRLGCPVRYRLCTSGLIGDDGYRVTAAGLALLKETSNEV